MQVIATYGTSRVYNSHKAARARRRAREAGIIPQMEMFTLPDAIRAAGLHEVTS